jgi:GNAT superfamily N-acetyltransferase
VPLEGAKEMGERAIQVRPLEAGDRETWERLFRGYIAFYEASVSDDVVTTTFARLLSDEPGTHDGLVAVTSKDGPPVGIAHVLFHRSTWSETGYVYLEDLFVAPDARGHGAGHALIRAVYDYADKRKATRTYWATQHFNETARALYDQHADLSPFVQYRRPPAIRLTDD